jgi:hypothetical protein
MIGTNVRIKKINISKNAISSFGAKCLGDGITTNGYLEELDIRENNLCDAGIQNILFPVAIRSIVSLNGLLPTKNLTVLRRIFLTNNNHSK